MADPHDQEAGNATAESTSAQPTPLPQSEPAAKKAPPAKARAPRTAATKGPAKKAAAKAPAKKVAPADLPAPAQASESPADPTTPVTTPAPTPATQPSVVAVASDSPEVDAAKDVAAQAKSTIETAENLVAPEPLLPAPAGSRTPILVAGALSVVAAVLIWRLRH